MVRLCGAALGFLAFSVTILLGLVAGNPAEVTLLRAVYAMLTFFMIGLFVGWVAYRVLDEHAVKKQLELFSEQKPDQSTASDPPSEQGAEDVRPENTGQPAVSGPVTAESVPETP